MKNLTIRVKLDVILQYGTLTKKDEYFIFSYYESNLEFGFEEIKCKTLDNIILLAYNDITDVLSFIQ